MRNPLYYIKKWLSMLDGYDHGLIKRGPWRVIYDDGKRTHPLEYGYACTLQELHGGTLSYIPDESHS